MIAALFVETNGAYFGIEGVDPWDIERDATNYRGPHPVVAHPPCARWSILAKSVEARLGIPAHEDGGLFAFALSSVRRWGGVLEHPANSAAWKAHGLNHPPSTGGWVNADFEGGWTCYVEQARYGHDARKGAWLYAHGVDIGSLEWGFGADSEYRWCQKNPGGRKYLSKEQRKATPHGFRDMLIATARSAHGRRP